MLISMMAMQTLKFYGNNYFLPATEGRITGWILG